MKGNFAFQRTERLENAITWRERAGLCRLMAAGAIYDDLAHRWRIAAGQWELLADQIEAAVFARDEVEREFGRAA